MWRSPRSCARPGCRKTNVRGSRFCEDHVQHNYARDNANFASKISKQNRYWSKWYSTSHWKNLRTLVLARDPVCKICEREASTVADHIRPHRGVWVDFVDMNNLQGLCEQCHGSKTAREEGGFGNPSADGWQPKKQEPLTPRFFEPIGGNDDKS